jgi:hypothetical protein
VKAKSVPRKGKCVSKDTYKTSKMGEGLEIDLAGMGKEIMNGKFRKAERGGD